MGGAVPPSLDKTVALPGQGAQIPGPVRRCPQCSGEFPADFIVCPRDATALPAPSEGDDPLVGAILAGSYRIKRVVAEGGMGRLYEAEHLRLERRLAVKVLHELYAKSADGVTRFEREARAASKVHSDHVLGVIDLLRTPDGRPCIVSDFLEGEDLQARLDRVGKLTVPEAVVLMRQICQALNDAHAGGIVHRDLKPSNIFLVTGPDGLARVKIVDFGVAKLSGERELTQTGAVVGTPAYMAPEQAQGSRDVDSRADIYAAGAVLYRMLTGRPPYEDDGQNPLVKLLHEEPARARSIDKTIPAGIEAVIEHAMARDPAARPDTAGALDAELAAFDIGGAAILAPVDGGEIGAAASTAAAAPAGTAAALSTSVTRRGGSTMTMADRITRSARVARPLAAGLALAAALLAGLALLALLDAVIRGVSEKRTRSEWMLVVLISGIAAVATAAVLARALVARWRSVPAVRHLSGVLMRALVAGLATLATLELLSRGLAATAGWHKALAAPANAARIILALAAAGLAIWRALAARR